MRLRKTEKNEAKKEEAKSERPKTLPAAIIEQAVMMASDAAEIWRKCDRRACRISQSCEAELFMQNKNYAACVPHWSDEQYHHYEGALHFGLVHFLPKIPEGVTMEDMKRKEGEKNIYDTVPYVLHVPRGVKLKIIDSGGEMEDRLPFWAEAPKDFDDVKIR
jgi:hypothetical protein